MHSTRLETRSGVTRREARSLAASAISAPVAVLESGKQDAMAGVAAVEDSSRDESVTAEPDSVPTPIAVEETIPPPAAETESAVAAKMPQASGNLTEAEVDEQPIAVVQPEPEVSARPIEVSLDEIAENCARYTSTGFELYADTIRGGLLTGRATVYSIRPDPSTSDHRFIKLTRKASGVALLLDLDAVPAEVAAGYQQGEEYGISGLIVDSRAFGSSCSVNLRYQVNSG